MRACVGMLRRSAAGSAHALKCITLSKVRHTSSEAALPSSGHAGKYYLRVLLRTGRGGVIKSWDYLMNLPFGKSKYLLVGERTRTHPCTHSEKFSRAVWSAPNKTLIFLSPANFASNKAVEPISGKLLITQRSASPFGPAGGATARWLNDFVGLLVKTSSRASHKRDINAVLGQTPISAQRAAW